MDKPLWVDRIQRDPQSYQSLLDFINENDVSLSASMLNAVKSDNLNEARNCAAEIIAWGKILHQLKMYEREEEQHGIIQEGR